MELKFKETNDVVEGLDGLKLSYPKFDYEIVKETEDSGYKFVAVLIKWNGLELNKIVFEDSRTQVFTQVLEIVYCLTEYDRYITYNYHPEFIAKENKA